MSKKKAATAASTSFHGSDPAPQAGVVVRGTGKTIKKRTKNGKVLTFTEGGRFAKGNAGGGRPKGSKNYGGLTTLLKEVLEKQTFKTADGREVNGAEALVEAALRRAVLKSDTLLEMIFDRVDGKVTQKVENSNIVREVRFTVHKRIKH